MEHNVSATQLDFIKSFVIITLLCQWCIAISVPLARGIISNVVVQGRVTRPCWITTCCHSQIKLKCLDLGTNTKTETFSAV